MVEGLRFFGMEDRALWVCHEWRVTERLLSLLDDETNIE